MLFISLLFAAFQTKRPIEATKPQKTIRNPWTRFKIHTVKKANGLNREKFTPEQKLRFDHQLKDYKWSQKLTDLQLHELFVKTLDLNIKIEIKAKLTIPEMKSMTKIDPEITPHLSLQEMKDIHSFIDRNKYEGLTQAELKPELALNGFPLDLKLPHFKDFSTLESHIKEKNPELDNAHIEILTKNAIGDAIGVPREVIQSFGNPIQSANTLFNLVNAIKKNPHVISKEWGNMVERFNADGRQRQVLFESLDNFFQDHPNAGKTYTESPIIKDLNREPGGRLAVKTMDTFVKRSWSRWARENKKNIIAFSIGFIAMNLVLTILGASGIFDDI